MTDPVLASYRSQVQRYEDLARRTLPGATPEQVHAVSRALERMYREGQADVRCAGKPWEGQRWLDGVAAFVAERDAALAKGAP